MKRLSLLLIILVLLMAGCSNAGTEPADRPENEKGAAAAVFEFDYNNISIPMHGNAAPILESLGEEMSYFEAESCAFQGMEKVYAYSGFELYTYELEGEDYVASVQFLDDSVSTQEGIELYSSLEDVLQAYGEDYKKEAGLYTYEWGKSTLSFLIEDDEVVSVEYAALAD